MIVHLKSLQSWCPVKSIKFSHKLILAARTSPKLFRIFSPAAADFWMHYIQISIHPYALCNFRLFTFDIFSRGARMSKYTWTDTKSVKYALARVSSGPRGVQVAYVLCYRVCMSLLCPYHLTFNHQSECQITFSVSCYESSNALNLK